MKQQSSYSYTSLVNLKKCNTKEKIHVFAKVIEVRNIRSVDILENVQLVSVIYLRDSSVNSFTRCIIYSEMTDIFAERIKIDQIIQLNHVHIRTNPGRPPSLYGKLNVDEFAIALINHQLGSGINVIFHSSANYCVPENCEEMIAALQVYSNNMPIVSSATNSLFGETLKFHNGGEAVCCLNQVVRFQYHNIVVQAISIFISDIGNVVLRCWDTTKPPSSIFVFADENIFEVIHADEELESLAKEYLCDIVFYNEHGDYLKKNVKHGDILLLVNVHYYVAQDCDMLTIHKGGKRYNRGIKILDDYSNQKAKLLNDVEVFVTNRTLSRQKVSDAFLSSEVARRKTTTMISSASGDNTVQESEARISIISRNGSVSANRVRINTLVTSEKTMASVFDIHHTIKKANFTHQSEACVVRNLRWQQMQAVQLGWIAIYIVKKWISEQSCLSLTSLQRFYILAKRGSEFLMTSALNCLRRENKDLLRKFVEMLLCQESFVQERYLLVYLKTTCMDIIRSNMINSIKKLTVGPKKIYQRNRHSSNEEQIINQKASWEFINSWSISLSFDCITPIFALICGKCGLWHITSIEMYGLYKLCPVCFKKIKMAGKKQNRWIFLSIVWGCLLLPFHSVIWKVNAGNFFCNISDEKTLFFLFPIALLAFFLIDVPENASDAVQSWKNGLGNEEKQKISNSVKEMLSKYSFTFTELKIRKVGTAVALFEVEKVVFTDSCNYTYLDLLMTRLILSISYVIHSYQMLSIYIKCSKE
uniref:POT1PC domain-containing protein n=1 Tax=Onchocerca volvulus TaxID=6282 RepID=A0A8R1Y3H1_ONCVO